MFLSVGAVHGVPSSGTGQQRWAAYPALSRAPDKIVLVILLPVQYKRLCRESNCMGGVVKIDDQSGFMSAWSAAIASAITTPTYAITIAQDQGTGSGVIRLGDP